MSVPACMTTSFATAVPLATPAVRQMSIRTNPVRVTFYVHWPPNRGQKCSALLDFVPPRQNMKPLLTLQVHERMRAALHAGAPNLECSLDLDRSTTVVEVNDSGWSHGGDHFPWLENCKDRTIYYWDGSGFRPASRFTRSLIKLVPTQWGPPTFEIDGIKMLPTAKVSPYADAERKVSWVQPRGKVILDTCGGLGYFAAWCLKGGAAQVLSYEKNPDVLWLRTLNPWSPQPGGVLQLTQCDVAV